MHTASQLRHTMFKIRLNGVDASVEQLFDGWEIHDRLGVVVHEPFGALGASQLIQLAITAFYDARPLRRAGAPKYGNSLAIYPDIYLFHVGRLYGDHSSLDVFPPRKEVLLPSDPAAVLEAINDRAISRLAVPDVAPVAAEHSWKEPAAARDRIASAFAYSPTGSVERADVEVTGLTSATEKNATMILDPHGPNGDLTKIPLRFGTGRDALASRYPIAAGVPESTRAARGIVERRRRIARHAGLTTESYRRVEVTAALDMLVP